MLLICSAKYVCWFTDTFVYWHLCSQSMRCDVDKLRCSLSDDVGGGLSIQSTRIWRWRSGLAACVLCVVVFRQLEHLNSIGWLSHVVTVSVCYGELVSKLLPIYASTRQGTRFVYSCVFLSPGEYKFNIYSILSLLWSTAASLIGSWIIGVSAQQINL